MTTTVLILALLAVPVAERLPFIEDDYPAALAAAKKQQVPLFIDAWAPWCHTCVFMREHVLNRPELTKHQRRYVFLSIDTEKETNAAFLQKYPIDTWPTLFLVDSAKETVLLRWLGSANVDQLGKLFDDGDKALRLAAQTKNSAEQKLALADRLWGEKKISESILAYRRALAAMSANHPRRARAIESLVGALHRNMNYADCVDLALTQTPTLPRGPSQLNLVNYGLSCYAADSSKAPSKPALGERLLALGHEALKLEGILADDRSSLYESLVDHLTQKGDVSGSVELAKGWLSFLEAEAAKASFPAARAAFDPHRLLAARAAGQLDRAIAPLIQSEQDLPEDYNPSARLALAYRQMGKLDEALAAVNRALKKVYGPRKLRVMETKADILSERGNLSEQKQVLLEAIRYAKGLPEGQRNLTTIARLETKAANLP